MANLKPILDLDESTPHRSDDWLRALGAQDAIKEDVLRLLEGKEGLCSEH